MAVIKHHFSKLSQIQNDVIEMNFLTVLIPINTVISISSP